MPEGFYIYLPIHVSFTLPWCVCVTINHTRITCVTDDIRRWNDILLSILHIRAGSSNWQQQQQQQNLIPHLEFSTDSCVLDSVPSRGASHRCHGELPMLWCRRCCMHHRSEIWSIGSTGCLPIAPSPPLPRPQSHHCTREFNSTRRQNR